MMDLSNVIVAPSVAEALVARRPVVALETTLVTHGFPHPEGLEIAAELEAAVAAGGTQPATIGIVDGRIRVGLDRAELEQLATCGRTAKLNLSNLAAHLVPGSWDRRPWRQPCSWRGGRQPAGLLGISAGTRGSSTSFRPTLQRFGKQPARERLVGPKRGFLVQGDDRVGAIAELLERLGDSKINVTAIDAVCADGRYGAIFWVAPKDVKKTAVLLGAQ